MKQQEIKTFINNLINKDYKQAHQSTTSSRNKNKKSCKGDSLAKKLTRIR